MYDDFIKEKQYISNVSPRTLEWFNQALAWWDGNAKTTVIKMRETGLSARSINSYRTAINSYLHWNTGSEEKCHPGCKHPRIPRIKDDDIRRGASVFHVQRQLGHSTLDMTKKYVNLVVDDLSTHSRETFFVELLVESLRARTTREQAPAHWRRR